MLRQRLWSVLAAVLVPAALLLTARSALGQAPGGYHYESHWYSHNPGYYARRHSVPPTVRPSKTAPTTRAYLTYVPAAVPRAVSRPSHVEIRITLRAAAPEPAERSARVELEVPEGAEVWFGSHKTTQTGTLRSFVSPPLAPGSGYAYEVRVAWKDGGREVSESRTLAVRAGDVTRASFPRPAR
jgi:uncharacterized protein (TIGR03000 family)